MFSIHLRENKQLWWQMNKLFYYSPGFLERAVCGRVHLSYFTSRSSVWSTQESQVTRVTWSQRCTLCMGKERLANATGTHCSFRGAVQRTHISKIVYHSTPHSDDTTGCFSAKSKQTQVCTPSRPQKPDLPPALKLHEHSLVSCMMRSGVRPCDTLQWLVA